MARSRLENDLTDEQLRWLSIALAVFLIPTTYIMYRHYRSLKTRYPAQTSTQVKAKLT